LVEQNQSQPLSLAIVPSSFTTAKPDDPNLVQGVLRIKSSLRHINVAIHNSSKYLVRLWDENNSWGFDNLHLEITALADEPDDKLVSLEKPIIVKRNGGVGWSANFPQVCPLPPGEILVRDVELPVKKDNKLTRLSAWSYLDFPLPEGALHKKMRMQAVFTIPEDDSTKTYHVWTGRIVSPVSTYLVRQETVEVWRP